MNTTNDNLSFSTDYRRFYEKLFDKVPAMLHSLDETGMIADVNEFWLESLGYDKAEVLGRDPLDFLTASSRKHVIEVINPQVRELGAVKNVPMQAVKKDGKALDVLLSLYADRAPDGFIERTFSVLINVTETKELKRTISLSDSILNNVQNIIVVSDRDGEIVYISPYVYEFLGYTQEEMLGDGWWEKVKGATGANEKVIAAAGAKGDDPIDPEPYESIIYHKNGDRKCLLFKDAKGPEGLMMGVGYDITERNESRNKLKRYSSRVELMLEMEKAILASENQSEIIYGILKKLINFLIYCNRISFTTFDEAKAEARFYFADAEIPNSLESGKVIPLSEFSSFEKIKDGTHHIVENLNEKTQLSPTDLEILRSSVNSYLIMPVMYKGKLIGSVNLGSRFTNPFQADDLTLIQEIATEIGIAIMHLRMQEELVEKNKVIESKNKDIVSSIMYAQRIQDALFPTKEFNDMNRHNESFVLFKPKDIVSGDFYWVSVEDDAVYFAVVDCTGHGVPGAFMSVVGFNLLNQALKEMHLHSPEKMLDYLNIQHYETFNKGNTDRIIQDGMDIGLCKYIPSTQTLEFAGANHNMYLMRRGNLQLYKGKRLAIGGQPNPTEGTFESYSISVQKDDIIYMSSDGYTDQFGGETGRKFLHNQMQELLKRIYTAPMQEQKELLDDAIKAWMGDQDQVDDICVIGVKI